jgi:hypothetical protein
MLRSPAPSPPYVARAPLSWLCFSPPRAHLISCSGLLRALRRQRELFLLPLSAKPSAGIIKKQSKRRKKNSLGTLRTQTREPRSRRDAQQRRNFYPREGNGACLWLAPYPAGCHRRLARFTLPTYPWTNHQKRGLPAERLLGNRPGQRPAEQHGSVQ